MNKIKIALVDDELTSRNTIKKLLERNEVYEIVVDFSNGKAALEWLRKNEVDILLCDMKMPEINGIELMRSIRILNQYLPIIVISGFDDFDFVRGSLINGASNYLLKHELTDENLQKVLDEVREKYKIVPEGKGTFQKKGYCIFHEKDFTADKISKMSQAGEIDFTCYNIVSIAIGPDYKYIEGINFWEYKQDICRAIQDILAQIFQDNYKYIVYITKQSHILLLLSFAEVCSTLLILNTINNFTNRLQRQVTRMLDLTVTIVTGEVSVELDKAIEESKKLNNLLDDKFYLNGNRIVMSSIAKKMSYCSDEIKQPLLKQLEFELEQNISNSIKTVEDIFHNMEEEKQDRKSVTENCKILIFLLSKTSVMEEKELQIVLERMKEYEMFDQLKKETMDLFEKQIITIQKKEEKYSSVIRQAMDFIIKNFTKDISLEKCAEITGSSYTYLSREFKRETGMRFVEFLNKQRVNKSKSLLLRQELSMKEIAIASGFRNYNYFFKVFKEMEGVTPSEFLAKK